MTAHKPDAYVRDGQAFGVVDGTFRGRWWNHYERGRSFLDGGFYAEAEADLRKALAHRAEDQRWARTYGLHFIPEYFPNRELGITLYHLGDYDAARNRLETSLDQESSALAAHYLDETRRALLKGAREDGEGPRIVTTSQTPDTPVAAMTAPLRVTISDDAYVAKVIIDGEPWPMAGSAPVVEVRREVVLRAGENTVEVIAEDLLGNRTTKHVALVTDHDGPAISFDETAIQPSTVRGVAYDPAGVAAVRIGGQEAVLQKRVDGSVAFQRSVTGPLDKTFVAVDSLGNETRGRIPTPHMETASHQKLRRAHLAAAMDLPRALAILPQAMAAVADTATVRLTNIVDGQRYLMDEIVVTVAVDAPAPVEALSLNGRAIPGLIPGSRRQQVSRRIRLEGAGVHALTVEARLSDGTVRTAAATVERDLTEVEQLESRLRVALLGNLWEGAAPKLQDEADFIVEELGRRLFERGRFDLISRDALPRVLQEQELRTVLGSRDLDAETRSIVPADLLTVGKVRRTGNTVEIVLQAVSAETSAILGYADVAGSAGTLEELRGLVRDLALRFEQEFPRVEGLVVDVPSATRCFVDLGVADRVREDLPCVVFRYGAPIVHPQTGGELGRPTVILAEGYLREVRDQLSRIALDDVDGTNTVQVSDHVLTK
jgi:hypothetical protein